MEERADRPLWFRSARLPANHPIEVSMWRIGLGIILAVSVTFAPLAAGAQPATKVPRVGILIAGSSPGQSYLSAFRQGLHELGYVEGQSIAIEYRWAEGKYERLPDLAAELVRLKVDVIVAVATP